MSNEKSKFYENKNFCSLPWTHLNVNPDGNAFPCCAYNFDLPVGNVGKSSLKELWNSQHMKQLRQQFMNDEQPIGCRNCWHFEAGGVRSMRQHFNDFLIKHVEEFLPTQKDGYFEPFKFRYLDIRFNNLCNLKCRTCGPAFSSSWQQEAIKFGYASDALKPISYNPNKNMIDELYPHLPYVDRLFFAGGEPLITEEHYKVLDYIIEHDLLDIPIVYNTNFTSLHYKDKNVLEYWKKLKNVRVNVSIDQIEEKAHYVRHGTNWPKMLQNRKLLREECPHVMVSVATVVSIFNVLDLPEIITHLKDIEFVDYHLLDSVNLNFVYDPKYFNIQNMSLSLKARAVEHLRRFLSTLEETENKDNIMNNIQAIIKFMLEAERDLSLVDEFKSKINNVDRMRDENFLEVFPELRELLIAVR